MKKQLFDKELIKSENELFQSRRKAIIQKLNQNKQVLTKQ